MLRVALFIDSGYLFKSAQGLLYRKPKFDLNILRDKLSNKLPNRSLLRAYYYDAYPAQSNPPTAAEKKMYSAKKGFFHLVDMLDYYQARVGRCHYVTVGEKRVPVQKMVDILLGVDMTQLAFQRSITDAILVAGDGDFLPAVEVARAAGVCIHLIHGPSYNKELHKHCDTRCEMTVPMIESWERSGSTLSSQKPTFRKGGRSTRARAKQMPS